MESLFILIPLSIIAVGVAVGVFFWMNHNGQFDDDQGPAWSILLDDDRPKNRQDNAVAATDVTIERTVHEKEKVAANGDGARGVRRQDPPSG